MGHTKGPWKADRVLIENAPDRMMVHVDAWGGPNIADCGTFEGDKEHIDNAKLIAAAPDLLDALKRRTRQLATVKVLLLQNDIEGALNEMVGDEVGYANGYPTLDEPAIAKAEGREP
jgi:hypothetical protein